MGGDIGCARAFLFRDSSFPVEIFRFSSTLAELKLLRKKVL